MKLTPGAVMMPSQISWDLKAYQLLNQYTGTSIAHLRKYRI